MAEDWSREEVELVVADYIQMLTLHFSGQPFSKAERKRSLVPLLRNRNGAAVERKRGNISAVLSKLGFHYLPGYKPLPNIQKLLVSVVLEQISASPVLDEAALAAAQRPAVLQAEVDFTKVRTDAPKLSPKLKEERAAQFLPVRRDYLEREAMNRSLGRAGEEFVVEFERWRLRQIGEERLASKVDWVSNTKGDGLGYDVKSFDGPDEPRFIEVKTTAFGAATPFFVSKNELSFSSAEEARFHLYRVFDFRHAPKLFDLGANLASKCLLDPVTYRASFS